MPRLISIITMSVFYYRLSVYITVYKLIFFLFISFTLMLKMSTDYSQIINSFNWNGFRIEFQWSDWNEKWAIFNVNGCVASTSTHTFYLIRPLGQIPLKAFHGFNPEKNGNENGKLSCEIKLVAKDVSRFILLTESSSNIEAFFVWVRHNWNEFKG